MTVRLVAEGLIPSVSQSVDRAAESALSSVERDCPVSTASQGDMESLP
jgi:hypothetical protein